MIEKGLIERPADNGSTRYYVAVPSSGHGRGVIVLHAWWGLTDFFKDVCELLAEEGFVAVAPDLFDGQTAGTVEEAKALAESAEYVATKTRVTRAVEVLLNHPAVRGNKIGIIGFSFGAAWALQLSTLDPAEIAAVVVFYGTNKLDFSRAKAAFLGHFAANDAYEPIADVRLLLDAIRGSGREVTFHVYEGTGHWFFEADQADAYDPEAARLAWERTVEFLKTHLET